MNRKKIFITGSTGLLGSHILAELLLRNLNSEIHALYRNKESFSEVRRVLNFYGLMHAFDSIRWHEGDICNLFLLESLIPEDCLVIHAAGKVSFSPSDKKELYRINRDATAQLVNICLNKKNIRLCYISSIAALHSSNSQIATESTFEPVPREDGPYHHSKFLGEMEVWRGMQEGLEAVILNPGLILSGFFLHQSSGNFLRNAIRFPFICPPGGSGMIFAYDAARIITDMALSDIKKERFILIENNYPYSYLYECLYPSKKIFKIPSIALKIPAYMNEWGHAFLKIPLKISVRMAQSASSSRQYSNEKILSRFPYIKFHPLNPENIKRFVLNNANSKVTN